MLFISHFKNDFFVSEHIKRLAQMFFHYVYRSCKRFAGTERVAFFIVVPQAVTVPTLCPSEQFSSLLIQDGKLAVLHSVDYSDVDCFHVG